MDGDILNIYWKKKAETHHQNKGWSVFIYNYVLLSDIRKTLFWYQLILYVKSCEQYCEHVMPVWTTIQHSTSTLQYSITGGKNITFNGCEKYFEVIL